MTSGRVAESRATVTGSARISGNHNAAAGEEPAHAARGVPLRRTREGGKIEVVEVPRQ